MFKKNTTNPNPAPKNTDDRDRWIKLGIIGAAIALVVASIPLLNSTSTDALTNDGKFCIQAVSDAGKFKGQAGWKDCGAGSDPVIEPTMPEVCETSDETVGRVATAQVQVARLNDSRDAFKQTLDQTMTGLASSTGQSIKVGTSKLNSLTFSLDDEAAADAVCDGLSPLKAMRVQLDYSAELTATLLGTRMSVADYRATSDRAFEAYTVKAAASFKGYDLGSQQAVLTGMVTSSVQPMSEAITGKVAALVGGVN
ncbi:hypothetical protein [Curtobacterium sp. PhB115]|uniref:hypothetical protein n=1 Tax=Curtobacterium sp. PhB115 TaxID=2485173 RepID=UPI000F4B0358|nr:hypothetical protein [Curtobacterium sp. PhB115]ROP74416.1 hypothetical protein EDF19_0500 [Curtobacterium sp. PhB115]